MKKLMLMAVAATAFAGTIATTAEAAQGCGRGYHRGPAGHCRPNAGPGYYGRGPVLVIGRWYDGRGYWDGRRYWQHRERWHRGWRYR